MSLSSTLSLRAAIAILFFAAIGGNARAETIEIFPSAVASCDEEFVAVAKNLKPGDELVLHEGTYSQPCRRIIQVNGLPDRPVIIRAAENSRPIMTRAANARALNNLEIVNSSFLVVRGLHFRGGNTGVRITGGSHITIEDCEISETLNNGMLISGANADFLIVRRNHIHHTGLYRGGPTEGEGIYVGCHDRSCRVSRSLFEGNYIHHLRATSNGGNDGIEIKPASYGNIIRDNVIHDTNIGTRYPCIFVYGGGAEANIVEGNAVWNCGEGIQVVADAVIRNNIVANCGVAGITVAPHAANRRMENVTIVNNTIVGHPTCVHIRWGGGSSLIFANNAAYCAGGEAISATGLADKGVTLSANFVEGLLDGVKAGRGEFIVGGKVDANFVSPADFDFWPRPKSALIGVAARAFAPPSDFNNKPRGRPATDVGAYDAGKLSSNPGWKIVPGFKGGNALTGDGEK